MNYKDRMFVVRELRKIARELLASSDYIYDPSHKNNPGKGFRPTPRGWTTSERRNTHEDRQDDSLPEKNVDEFRVSELNQERISRKINSIRKEVEQCVANIKRVRDRFNAELKRNKNALDRFNEKYYEYRKNLEKSGKKLTPSQEDIMLKISDRFGRGERKLNDKLGCSALIGLSLPKEKQGKFQIGKVKSEVLGKNKIYETPLQYFEKIVDQNVMPIRLLDVSVKKRINEEEREKCDGKTIYIYNITKFETCIHEAAHWIEMNNPRVKKLCIEFLDYRTHGEEPESLKKLFENSGVKYEENEFTRKDKFPHPYCGKIYETNGKTTATEILSMGVQMLKENWEDFYKQDPEYFCFVIGVLRGLL